MSDKVSASKIVDIIRAQNRAKRFTYSDEEMINLLEQTIATAFAAGVAEGTRKTGEHMLKAFDKATAPKEVG